MKKIVKLSRIKATKLFGYVDFDLQELDLNTVNFLIGMNGMGKTTTLNLINDISTRSFKSLFHNDFKSLMLTFNITEVDSNISYSKKLYLEKTNLNKINWVLVDETNTIEDIENNSSLNFNPLPMGFPANGSNKAKVHWFIENRELTNNKVAYASCKIHYTVNSKGHYSELQVLNVVKSEIEKLQSNYNKTKELEFLKHWNVCFILYDRLFIERDKFGIKRINSLQKGVTLLDEEMKILMKDHVVEASDRNITEDELTLNELEKEDFTTTDLKSDEELKELVDKINKLESNLVKYDLIPKTKEIELPSKLPDVKREIFSFLIQNKYNRVKPHEEFLNRLQIFEDFINSCFVFKKIQTSRNKGIISKLNSNGIKKPREISLDRLSSGEQHLLIMAYKVIFGFPKSSYILIDEPEVSMHLEWQEEFIDLLEKVGKIRNLNFLCATHSPATVGYRTSQLKAIRPLS